MKMDVWKETHDKVKEASARTGQSMAQIINLLVRYNLNDIGIEANVRRSLVEFARNEKNKKALNLSRRQRKVIENAVKDEFTKDLL